MLNSCPVTRISKATQNGVVNQQNVDLVLRFWRRVEVGCVTDVSEEHASPCTGSKCVG
jgi:hypothetical protein